MPLNDQDIRALTYLAERCRPRGAPKWEPQGIFAAIAKVRQMAVADVALAVIRAADDGKAHTPGVIANTAAPNWKERGTDRPQPIEPYEADDTCGTCGKSRFHCARNPLSDHEFEPMAQLAASAVPKPGSIAWPRFRDTVRDTRASGAVRGEVLSNEPIDEDEEIPF